MYSETEACLVSIKCLTESYRKTLSIKPIKNDAVKKVISMMTREHCHENVVLVFKHLHNNNTFRASFLFDDAKYFIKSTFKDHNFLDFLNGEDMMNHENDRIVMLSTMAFRGDNHLSFPRQICEK